MHVYIKVLMQIISCILVLSQINVRLMGPMLGERERVYPDVACGAVVQILSFYFLFRIFNHFYLLNHTVIFEIFHTFEFLKPRALE